MILTGMALAVRMPPKGPRRYWTWTSPMRTARTVALPFFFTHGIGSLPRPQVVRELLARREGMAADLYRRALDDMVLFAIRLQEQAGLDVVSDGEWRRSQYIREFLQRIGGFEKCRRYTHQGESKLTEVVVRRMETREPVFLEDAPLPGRA